MTEGHLLEARVEDPVAESLTGWSATEAQGKRLVDILPLVDPTTRAAAHASVDRALQEGSTIELAELALLARGGVERTVKGRLSPMRELDGTPRGAVLVVRDITAEKQAAGQREQLERQIIVADRLASVGTLAGGVAHEINNPLACVTANIELIAEGLRTARGTTTEQRSEREKLWLEARDGEERIRKVVRGLMPFASPERDRRTAVALEPALDGCIDLAFSEFRHRARLRRTYGPVPCVLADEGRLGQVFVHLLSNAAHAIPVGHREANEIHVTTSTDAQGRAVVEIRDTGSGIAPEARGRVFEPFFTTKAVGAGMGLGLSVCHSLVSSLGGEITASNHPDGGAVFCVVLPPAPDREPAASAADASPPKVARGRASVLIVDDDRLVAKALARVLREHECVILNDAREARELLLRKPFDVILSDLMMPDMTGMELHAALPPSDRTSRRAWCSSRAARSHPRRATSSSASRTRASRSPSMPKRCATSCGASSSKDAGGALGAGGCPTRRGRRRRKPSRPTGVRARRDRRWCSRVR